MIAFSKLPRSGIGNKLFIWAQGLIFSKVNNCDFYTIGWVKLHIGPIFRREKSFRFYFGYIRINESLKSIIHWLKSINTPSVFLVQQQCNLIVKEKKAKYVFETIPQSTNYFEILRDYRTEIIFALNQILNNRIHKKVEIHESPEIGIHVRMGDFKVGNIITPIKYYVEMLAKTRELYGNHLKATVFTDGTIEEVKVLLDIHNVELAKDDLDIVHLLVLSKSKIIILTSNSTFSQWAGFLSDAILIYDKRIIKHRIRLEPHLIEEGNEK